MGTSTRDNGMMFWVNAKPRVERDFHRTSLGRSLQTISIVRDGTLIQFKNVTKN